jgi:transposase
MEIEKWRASQIPTVEEEDAKWIERERKHLVEQRTSIVGRIKSLLALHGIHLSGKRIGKGLRERVDHIRTGDGPNLAPFLRRDIERMLLHYELFAIKSRKWKRIENRHSWIIRVTVSSKNCSARVRFQRRAFWDDASAVRRLATGKIDGSRSPEVVWWRPTPFGLRLT